MESLNPTIRFFDCNLVAIVAKSCNLDQVIDFVKANVSISNSNDVEKLE